MLFEIYNYFLSCIGYSRCTKNEEKHSHDTKNKKNYKKSFNKKYKVDEFVTNFDASDSIINSKNFELIFDKFGRYCGVFNKREILFINNFLLNDQDLKIKIYLNSIFNGTYHIFINVPRYYNYKKVLLELLQKVKIN